jgi:hypothetical protein
LDKVLIVDDEDYKRPIAGLHALKRTSDVMPRGVLDVWLTFDR